VLPVLLVLLLFTHRRNLRAVFRQWRSKGEVHEHS
jgi:hypothetical protein